MPTRTIEHFSSPDVATIPGGFPDPPADVRDSAPTADIIPDHTVTTVSTLSNAQSSPEMSLSWTIPPPPPPQTATFASMPEQTDVEHIHTHDEDPVEVNFFLRHFFENPGRWFVNL